MRVLSIGSDPTIAKKDSPVFLRHKIYAKEIGKLVIVSRTVGGSDEIIEDEHLKIVPTASKNLIRSFIDLRRIALEESKKLRPDIVTSQDPFEHGFIAWRISKASSARLHLQVHTDVSSSVFSAGGWKNKIRQLIAKFLLKKAKAVRVVSQRIARGIERWGIRQNVSILPISVDIKDLLKLSLPKKSDGDFTILTMSRLSEEKRIDILIRAISILKKMNISTKLLIAGDGPEREGLSFYADKLGVSDQVEFLGWQKFSEASQWADCYAQASAFEGYGLSLFEASACGLPIVTTSVGLVGEVLVPGESCLLARDANSFAQSFSNLINDFEYRQRLGINARQTVGDISLPQEEYARRYAHSLSLALPDPRNVGPIMIVTQVLDQDDPILGFFCRWLDEISNRVPAVTAVCLRLGKYQPPSNVRIISLGKEKESKLPKFIRRILYAIKFKWICWKERHHYSSVFVHMNQEYVLLSGIIWKLLRKRVLMWRNHYHGSLLTRMAGLLCDVVLCTSKKSFTANFINTRFMPVGVDLNLFKKEGPEIRKQNSILMLGRIAPSKNVDLLIEAVTEIKNHEVECTATIVGNHLLEDEKYYSSLKQKTIDRGMEEMITWISGIPNNETPKLYRSHEIFVNASKSGMFDKTIIEAASSGCKVVYCSDDAKELFNGDGYFELSGGEKSLAEAILIEISKTKDPSSYINGISYHSIENLMDELRRFLVV